MEITLSLPMLLFLMLMTGFAGFVDSAAGGGGLIGLPAYLLRACRCITPTAPINSARPAAPPLPRRSSSRREP